MNIKDKCQKRNRRFDYKEEKTNKKILSNYITKDLFSKNWLDENYLRDSEKDIYR